MYLIGGMFCDSEDPPSSTDASQFQFCVAVLTTLAHITLLALELFFFLILMHNKCGSRVWRKEMASDRWLILSCVTCLCKTGHAQGSPWMMWTPCPFSKVLHKGKCEVCESFWSRSCLELSCPSEKSFLSASASDVLSSNFIILSLKSA